jgi:L-alanine-DL-glutamate epimerase-like enolase superfamily enzyme
MRITRVETIPVGLPVGKFRDGMDKVIGSDAPPRHAAGRPAIPRRSNSVPSPLVLANVIVRIHTDEGLTGTGEAACDEAESVEVVQAMLDRHMAPR